MKYSFALVKSRNSRCSILVCNLRLGDKSYLTLQKNLWKNPSMEEYSITGKKVTCFVPENKGWRWSEVPFHELTAEEIDCAQQELEHDGWVEFDTISWYKK